MSIPIDTIIDKAKASGFDAELRVAAILRNADWTVSQSVYYIDKDENKGREIDIIADRGWQSTDEKPEVTCRINLCIEVKRSADPFILFSDKPERHEGGTGFATLHWKKQIDRFILNFHDIERARPFKSPKRLSRAYSSVKDNRTQHLRSGIISAFKGAIYSMENANETYSNTSRDICFYIPMVVVDGQMFECYFGPDVTELLAEEVQRSVFVQNYLSEDYGAFTARVNVVTMAELPSVVAEYKAWGSDLISTMKERRNAFSPSLI